MREIIPDIYVTELRWKFCTNWFDSVSSSSPELQKIQFFQLEAEIFEKELLNQNFAKHSPKYSSNGIMLKILYKSEAPDRKNIAWKI